MEAKCPNCKAVFHMADSKLSSLKTIVQCPQCHDRFVITNKSEEKEKLKSFGREKQIAKVGTIILFLFFWIGVPYFFFVHEGYVLLLFPGLAKSTKISEIENSRFVLLKGNIVSNIYKPPTQAGPSSQRTPRLWVNFKIRDSSGIAYVRFHPLWSLEKTDYPTEIIGAVVDKGKTVKINAVKVNRQLPWPMIGLISLILVIFGVFTYLDITREE